MNRNSAHGYSFSFSHGRHHFVDGKFYTFCDIKFEFVISQNKLDFVISQNELDFVISQIRICDINKSSRFCDITKSTL